MDGDEKKKLKILQISNISVAATKDQVFSMCQYLGRIDDVKVYPSDAHLTSTTTQKVAFVKFEDERCVEVGQHLTNTVLVDRALVCVPYLQDFIPDEETFINSGGVAMAGVRQLPPHVQNRIQTDADGHSILLTVDPTLEQLGLPAYPSLPGDTDPAKVEEIRRTIYVGNLPKGVDGNAVVEFFNMFGEVMYARLTQVSDALVCAYAYVEFSQQNTVPIALQNNGIEFNGRPLKIQHSRVAIIKPQQKTADQALEEVEEAIRMGKTRSTDRRSRSPQRAARRRSPSPKRRRSGSRRRSRSRERRRSGSRDRKRSRSRDKKRSRSRDRRSRRSRSRDKDRKERKRSRTRSRDRKKDRKERKRSRSRSKDRKKDKRDRTPEKKRRTSSDVEMKDASSKKAKDEPKSEPMDDVEMNEDALRETLLKKYKNGKSDSTDRYSDKGSPRTSSGIKNEPSDSD